MKKKILSIGVIAILIALLFVLTGCGAGENTTKKETTNGENTSELVENVESDVNASKLADVVEVGDYVNYDANSGLATPETYTPNSSLTGYNNKQSTYSSADETKWRVLSIDKENGTVDLVAENKMADLHLKGKEGYINSETVLNNIGAVYGHGKGATGGRSINIEDIEQYSSYEPSKYKDNYTKITYGETKKYTSGTFIKTEEITGGVEEETDSRLVVASESNPVTVKQSLYLYSAKNYIKNETVYKMLFKDGDSYKEYWLASRSVDLYDNEKCSFEIRTVGSGYANSCDLEYSDNSNTSGYSRGVVPVVSLQSNIQTIEKDENGAWNLVVK